MILTNATIINSDKILESHTVTVDEQSGLIKSITNDLQDVKDERVIDCKNMWLFPGLIDIHVHLRDLSQSQKEDFNTGSQAAIHGGYTTLFDMPNKQPPINNQLFFQKVQKLSESITTADIYNYVLIDEQLLSESFNWTFGKIFFGGTTATSGVEYDIFDKINHLQEKFFAIHAEDKNEIIANSSKFNKNDPKNHNKIRSPNAELIAVDNVLSYLEKNRNYLNRYHIAHVTLPETVRKILSSNVVNLSFEVTPHHMFLCEDDIEALGNYIKVNPPLRSHESMHELRDLWIAGKVPIIASDHAPHLKEEKLEQKVSGLPSLDTNLRLLIDYCLRSNITPSLITKTCSTNPANLMALNDRGIIEEGKKADLVLVDPTKSEIVKKLYTKCNWSPWQGKSLQGIPVFTMKNAKVVFKHENYDL